MGAAGLVIIKLEILAVKVGRHIAGLFAALELALVGLMDDLLDLLPAVGVDGVRNVGVQLQAIVSAIAVAELEISLVIEPLAAVIAIAGAEMVLISAGRAVVG